MLQGGQALRTCAPRATATLVANLANVRGEAQNSCQLCRTHPQRCGDLRRHIVADRQSQIAKLESEIATRKDEHEKIAGAIAELRSRFGN
jgi:hypothetical protein